MSWIKFLTLAVCLASATTRPAFAAETPRELRLTAKELYGGYEATRILLKDAKLVLDTRRWHDGAQGVVTTDVIDLAGEDILKRPAKISDLRIRILAESAAGARVSGEVRTGATYFQAPGTWTAWRGAEGVIQPRGRFAQVRLRFSTTDAASAPAVGSIILSYRLEREAVGTGTVALVSDGVQRIINSPLDFRYERPDQPDLAWLRETFQLDRLIAGKKSEFEQLHALMQWVARRPNDRHEGWHGGGPYPWHIRKVMAERNGGTIFGHCMSYCEVMLAAANALGWHGRHWAIHGIRDTSHEVAEIWVNELGKWVYFDASLDTYYADQKTGEPLNLHEMHNLYLQTVLKPGEQQKQGRHHNEDRLKQLRGKHPIACVTGNYAYGKPSNWDWEWDHGYMTAGWMQLTPRNNWHSRPEPGFAFFGWGPEGYGGFPLYIDEQTPLPEPSADNMPMAWHTRERDFWWTLNLASFRLTRGGEKTLQVECGNSQPFFQRYLAKIDGRDWEPVDSRFTWRLKPGKNRLEVAPEDDYGKKGLSSVAVVEYIPVR